MEVETGNPGGLDPRQPVRDGRSRRPLEDEGVVQGRGALVDDPRPLPATDELGGGDEDVGGHAGRALDRREQPGLLAVDGEEGERLGQVEDPGVGANRRSLYAVAVGGPPEAPAPSTPDQSLQALRGPRLGGKNAELLECLRRPGRQARPVSPPRDAPSPAGADGSARPEVRPRFLGGLARLGSRRGGRRAGRLDPDGSDARRGVVVGDLPGATAAVADGILGAADDDGDGALPGLRAKRHGPGIAADAVDRISTTPVDTRLEELRHHAAARRWA